MNIWREYKTICICYGILAIGMIAVLLGAPDTAVMVAALPGSAMFVVYLYRYMDQEVGWLIRMMRDQK